MVKKKMRDYALNYLNTLKEKHSKMDNLSYPKLRVQNYLKDGKITVSAAKNLFKWRTRAAQFKLNYSNSYQDTSCPFCKDEPDSQEHSLQCKVVTEMIEIVGEYDEIFDDDISSDISNTIEKISKLREEERS